MSKGFYSRLAVSNLKKNARFYIPRILTETGLLASFYIVLTLTLDNRLRQVRGGSYLPSFMGIGVAVMVILSVILMLYTNSFIMKQRKREFGLYNVLGMEKRHVTCVLFFESMISGIISIIAGLLAGMLLYKGCALAIVKLLQADIPMGAYFINVRTTSFSAVAFIVIDVFVFIINCISIARLKPVEMLASKSAGEKEPKVKWPLLVIGALSLGAGYYIALSVENPLKAISYFFIAVILVIIGTYFLFVAGTIWVLKLLKKNKKFYYNRRHMPAVSGLLYRMKQNAVGLASITILATGVLVMISTTVALYAGMDSSLNRKYREHMYVSLRYATEEDKETGMKIVEASELEPLVQSAADSCKLGIKNMKRLRYLEVAYLVKEGSELSAATDSDGRLTVDVLMKSVTAVLFVTQDQYEALTQKDLKLKDDEVALCKGNCKLITKNVIQVAGKEYAIAEELQEFPIQSSLATSVDSMYMVLPSEEALQNVYESQLKDYAMPSYIDDVLAVTFEDLDAAAAQSEEFSNAIYKNLDVYLHTQEDYKGAYHFGHDSYWEEKAEFLGMYGTLLFLGILLGIVFMFATTLIIYYKQISEGYEDALRFQIMEKVGMSKEEVRGTIKSQILLVFFLPILVAGIHMCVASPILLKMLHIFMLSSDALFYGCALIVYAVFVLLYTFIYLGTARTYYKIVR